MITNEPKITIKDDKITINKDKDKKINQSRGQDNNQQIIVKEDKLTIRQQNN